MSSNSHNLNKKRVLVAMSGGVDSSVAIAKLIDEGYEAIGITLKLWETKDPTTNKNKASNCNSIEAINGAKMVCDRLGVHHYTLDHIETFRKSVVEDFKEQYLSGRTPNPCVRCNSEVKWGTLIEQANRMGAYYISTGHYARIENKDNEYVLKKGLDISKDQSYMLWKVDKEHLKRTLLPIGKMKKKEVREYAEKIQLETSAAPESQDLCFVMEGDYRRFLHEAMPDIISDMSEGDITDEDGNKIGNHSGFINYTIGQRRGLGLSFPTPRYVKKINPISNQVMVAEKKSIYSNRCFSNNINWLIDKPETPLKARAKIRYNSDDSSVEVESVNNRYRFTFEEPQLAITPGQSVAIYNKDILIGGGIIESYDE